MKIGLFDPYLDALGGGERYMLTIAQCLRGDHQIDLFWKDSSILNKAEERFGLKLEDVFTVDNIFSPDITFLQRFHKSKEYDLIIFLSDGSIPLLSSRKLFVHFQFPVKNVKINPLLSLKLSRVDKIICNSQYTKSYIDSTFKKKSEILYPPANTEIFANNKASKKNIILSVGRINLLSKETDFKKFKVMIPAFQKLYNQNKVNWRLALALSFSDKEKSYVDFLEKKAQGLPVDFYKNIPFERLISLYKSAKIYWHIAGFGEDLKIFPERAEHFGISTVEAQGAGAVPIAFDAGGQKEIIHEKIDGFLFKDMNILIDQTQKLINNPPLLEKVSQKSIQNASRFSQQEFCRNLNKLIL